MKIGISIILLSFFCCVYAQKWISSTEENLWQVNKIEYTKYQNSKTNLIDIDIHAQYQEIEGWGGSFNEIGWAALLALDEDEREKVIEEIFDPQNGLKFNICRVPIGASDFTFDNIQQDFRYPYLKLDKKYDHYYSLNDSTKDFEMKHFSIERDKVFLLPYIKSAMKYRPDLRIWGSPWTPPHWMMTDFRSKTCDSVKSYAGYFKGYYGIYDPEKYRKSYAEYFAKFVKKYQEEGINVYAIHIQNEFSLLQYWVSCRWTGTDLADFIGEYLGPRFNDKNSDDYNVLKDIEIWHGTLNSKTWDSRIEFKREVLPVIHKKSSSSKYTTGVSYQYKGNLVIERTKEYNNSLKLMASETRCGKGDNSWEYAMETWDDMYKYLTKGVNSYMQWNMILDDYTRSSFRVGMRECDYWAQNAMITINTSEKKVIYNPQFYIVKHFSHFIQPGAKRIMVDEEIENVDVIAFYNSDNSIVVNIRNGNDSSITSFIKCGNRILSPKIPANSVNTFIIQ